MYVDNGNSPTTSDVDVLLKALPKEPETDPKGIFLAKLVRDISHKKIPVRSFSRIWILGSLHAQIAAGYFAYWLRSRLADAEGRQRLRHEAHLSAALKLLGTMGYLRGAVMKLGQMLGNLPEVVPEEFAEVLSALHFEAPPMHYSMVREVFLDEFGKEPEELFAYFDKTAFAAASLGQVHRARLHGGEEVAVKVQYPGIARTIRTDLRNLRIILQSMRLSKDWQNTMDKVAEVERVLLMETDYEQEAEFGRRARQAFTAADRIVVPRIFDDFSTKRVLTTDYLPGRHLEEYLATNPSQEERDHYTDLVTVATFRLYYRLKWIMADPHPGNVIFMDDGRLGLIDFGCTRALSEEEWLLAMECEDAAIACDIPRLNRLTARACLCASLEEMEPERLETVSRGVYWQVEPWMKEGLFDFGDREFFRRGVDCLIDMTRKKYTRSEPLYLWTNRFILGGRAFCYRLRGRCNFRALHKQERYGELGEDRKQGQH